MKDGSPSSILSAVVSVREVLQYLHTDCYFDKKSAARYLSIGIRTLEEHLAEIVHYRIGSKKVVIKRSDLDAWVEQFRERTTAQDLGKIADEAIAKHLRKAK